MYLFFCDIRLLRPQGKERAFHNTKADHCKSHKWMTQEESQVFGFYNFY